MKPVGIFLLAAAASLAGPARALAQTVHPAGAAVIPLNWQPASNSDLLLVDVDGDSQTDIVFAENNQLPTGGGQPTRYFFTASGRSGAEIALDSVEFDSPHRFAAGDLIRNGLQWSGAGGYLAYTLIGNGGTGGRGFFRNGASGYVVLRKRVAGAWRYWWFSIAGRSASTGTEVRFYGQSSGVLATPPATTVADALAVYPNPAADGQWQLQGNGSYQLRNAQGQLLRSGTVTTAVSLDATSLPAGSYLLQFRSTAGITIYRKLVRL